jgi:ubiquinone/menaquinone biosynthesis C-methylase UbiE
MKNKIQKSEWDKAAEWWDAGVGDSGAWHQQHEIDPALLKMIGNVKNKKILEIGCGNGYLSRKLAKTGAKVTASDLAKKFIEIAEKKELSNPLGIEYIVRDAAYLNGLNDKSFDIVIANMCLMDMKNIEKAISEISRVLKRGGNFVFSILHPAFSSYYQHWDTVDFKNKKTFARVICRYLTDGSEKTSLWESSVIATHYHRPLQTYVSLLKKSNFTIGDIREIATKKKITKEVQKDRDISQRRSRYRTEQEKRIREEATKEIPYFMIIQAIK